MPPKHSINSSIQNIERAIKQGRNLEKVIQDLRNSKNQNALLTIQDKKYTLLMYFVLKNDFQNICKLLQGDNSADVLKTNQEGENALYLAVHCACEGKVADLAIIDELLKYNAQKQAALTLITGETPLLLAVRYNRLDIVSRLAAIDNKEQFLISSDGKTPLYFAVKKSFLPIVDELLKHYPEQQLLAINNVNQFLPIHKAIKENNTALIDKLLDIIPEQQLIHIFIKNNYRLNAIHVAIQFGNLELVEKLYNIYPQLINFTDILSALLLACDLNKFDIAKFLLETGADKQVLSKDHQNFISLTRTCNHDNVELAELLLKSQSQEQIWYRESDDDYTILMRCCYEGRLALVRLILQTISEKRLKDYLSLCIKDGRIALHLAIENANNNPNQYELIKELLAFYPEEQLLKIDNTGRAAIHYACEKGDIKIVNELLKFALNDQLSLEFQGSLPLHIAVAANHFAVIGLLKKYIKPEDFKKVDRNNMQPLHIAIYYKHESLAKWFLKEETDRLNRGEKGFCYIHLAAQQGILQLINDKLLNKDEEDQLKACTDIGSTILHIAVIANNLETADWILAHAEYLINELDSFNRTALHYACFSGSLTIVKLLVGHQANINAPDKNNFTPLHFASLAGNTEIVDYLIEKGADVAAKTNHFLTPLHFACKEGHVVIAESLIAAKSDIDAKDVHEGTSLFYAVAWKHKQIAKKLLELGANPDSAAKINGLQLTPHIIAIVNHDIAIFKLLARKKANIDDEIKCNDEVLTTKEFIENIDEHSVKQALLKEIDRVKLKQQINEMVVEPKCFIYETSSAKHFTSGYSHLKGLGLDKSDIDNLKKDQKLKHNPLLTLFSEPIKKANNNIVYTWFNDQFNSEKEVIDHIESKGSNKQFCFLDKISLKKQGCDIELLEGIRLVFNHKHIKKLSQDKGIYRDRVNLPSGPAEIVYTHELKIDQLSRILLFEIPSDDNKACLYVGGCFQRDGLHTKGDIKAVQASGASGHVIDINWPIDKKPAVSSKVLSV